MKWLIGVESPTWDIESDENRAANKRNLATYSEVIHPASGSLDLGEFPLRELNMWHVNGTVIDDLVVADFYFREEQERFGGSRRRKDGFPVLKEACHALFWACALDEALRRNFGGTYEDFRRAHTASGTVDGVRYVRNRVAHQFQVVLEVTGGAAFPIELPAVFFEYRWRPSAALPEPDQAGQERRRASYDSHLAGVPAYRTLRELESFFKDAFDRLCGPASHGRTS